MVGKSCCLLLMNSILAHDTIHPIKSAAPIFTMMPCGRASLVANLIWSYTVLVCNSYDGWLEFPIHPEVDFQDSAPKEQVQTAAANSGSAR